MIVVLLSGGLDSVAAFHYCLGRGRVFAVAFSYGQPHRDAELCAAQTVSERHSVPFKTLLLPEIPRMNPRPGRDASSGISNAFVPGRNGLFLARAASEYARPGEPLTLVMGANLDDCAAFPDCRPSFFESAQSFLRQSFSGMCEVSIQTPWLTCSKASIIRWAMSNTGRRDIIRDIRESVSCYNGTRCGTCDACTLRARAFAEVGIEDGVTMFAPFGGDPHREAAFRT